MSELRRRTVAEVGIPIAHRVRGCRRTRFGGIEAKRNGVKMGRFSMLVLILWVVSWAAQANVPAPSQTERKLGDNFKNIQSFMTVTNAVVGKFNSTAVSGLNSQLNDAKLQLGLQPQLNIVQGSVVTDVAPQVYGGERYSGIVPKFETPYYQNGAIIESAWSQAFRPF